MGDVSFFPSFNFGVSQLRVAEGCSEVLGFGSGSDVMIIERLFTE